MILGTPHEVGKMLVAYGLIDPPQLKNALEELFASDSDDLLRHLERKSLLTPYQVQKLEKGESDGYYLDRYKLLYPISAGTFARVFRGVDGKTRKGVAIKILRDRFNGDDAMVKSFYREARLTENFDHPSICRMLGNGFDANTNQHFIALDFIEGGNLREFLKIRKKLAPLEMVRLAIEMAEGLRYAIERGVTHRDIKATNVLFSASGHIVWIDFGLGGSCDKSGKKWNVEQRTVEYATLETATRVAEGDPRSDIFFLGAIFYEMITGKRPFPERPRDESRAQMIRIRYDEIETLTDDRSVPRNLAVVIDKMLAFRADERYQEYESIVRDLTLVSRSLEVAASEPPPGAVQRVMVVHQSKKIRDLLREKLSERGYQVAVIESIEQAVGVFKIKPAQCLIIDIDTAGVGAANSFLAMTRSGGGSEPACCCIFLATDDQVSWTNSLASLPVITLKKPVKLGPILVALKQLFDSAKA